MSRNSSGTYTLPSGNPVTTTTTITSTWANNTLGDIEDELTNSLDRQGRGAMTGQLQATSGTVTAPGITFDGDTNTGIYRSAADTVRVTAGGTAALEATATAVSALVPVGLPNGSSSAPALYFTSAPDTGLYVSSGGVGVSRNDGVTTSPALLPLGTIDLSGQGSISKTTAIGTGIFCKERIARCWGLVSTDNAGNAYSEGQNIASVTLPGSNVVRVTFAQAMASTNYAVIRFAAEGMTGLEAHARMITRATGYFEVTLYDLAGAAIDPTTTYTFLEFVIFGGL